jgi:hypothetical protein
LWRPWLFAFLLLFSSLLLLAFLLVLSSLLLLVAGVTVSACIPAVACIPADPGQCCGSGMFIPDPAFYIPDPHRRIQVF